MNDFQENLWGVLIPIPNHDGCDGLTGKAILSFYMYSVCAHR